MTRYVLLDSGPLGLITGPHTLPNAEACRAWLDTLVVAGVQVRVPDLSDYEVRRELLRAGRTASIRRVDALRERIGYLPIATETLMLAAEHWAQLRRQGRPTAPDLALDGDVILAAQAALLIGAGHSVVVATTNVGHLSRLVPADEWQNISA